MIIDFWTKGNKKIQKFVLAYKCGRRCLIAQRSCGMQIPFVLTEWDSHEAGAELLTVKVKVNDALLREAAGTIKVFSLHGGIDEDIREQNAGHHAEEMLE